MIYNGNRYGIRLFKGHILWFTDFAEAKRVELRELAKFTAQDREREAERLARLGIQADPPLSYHISLSDTQPGRTPRRS